MTTTMNPAPVHAPPARPGEWRRPEPGEHRSPCPALNSLANGGYLPRDGQVTEAQLVEAMNERLGVTPSVGVLLAKVAMARLGKVGSDGIRVLDLAALGKHGFIEHDASLTRRDAREGDAAEVVPALVEQLLSLSEDGRTLTLEDLAAAHRLRMAQSAAGGHAVPFKAGVLGTFEAALLYQVLRGSEGIATPDARELVESERVPARVAPRKVGWGSLLITAARIAVVGSWPFSRAARRARDAASSCPFPAARPRPQG